MRESRKIGYAKARWREHSKKNVDQRKKNGELECQFCIARCDMSVEINEMEFVLSILLCSENGNMCMCAPIPI